MIMMLLMRVCGLLALVSGILWLYQWDPQFKK